MTALLRAESVCRNFGPREVLKSASLYAVPGRISALFGRNGCGKTTLLRVAGGLLTPHAGAVHFEGHCWTRPRLAQLARLGLFYLPARDLLPWTFTLGESLAWVEHTWRTGRASAAIELLRLESVVDAEPYEMSGGERRRAEVAVAYARAPRCLLADEPLGGIAPKDVELLTAVFRAMAGEGCAIVATGHEVDAVFELADEVTWMASGTTHVLGTPAQAAQHFQFRREYLGT